MILLTGAIFRGSSGLSVWNWQFPLLHEPIMQIGATLNASGSLRVERLGVPYFNGQVDTYDDADPHDPEIWVLDSLKIDEDGEPVKEALFANHNAKMRIECDGNSLVGRIEAKRGVAHKIEVEPPLQLVAGNKLVISTAQDSVIGDLQAEIADLRAEVADLRSLINGAPNSLQNQIYGLTAGSEVTIESLQAQITAEVNDRIAADSSEATTRYNQDVAYYNAANSNTDTAYNNSVAYTNSVKATIATAVNNHATIMNQWAAGLTGYATTWPPATL